MLQKPHLSGRLTTGILVVCVCGAPHLARAQQPSQPAPPSEPSRLRPNASALVAGASFALATFLDRGIRNEAQLGRNGFSNGFAHVGNTFGTISYVVPALGVGYLAGSLAGSNALRQGSRDAFMAAGLAGTLSMGLKFLIGRTRPLETSDIPSAFRPFRLRDASFPSGHTALAFATATAFAAQTSSGWSDALLYAGASLTALSRINDDKHWATDVLAGAGIGYLAGKFVTRGHDQPVAGTSSSQSSRNWLPSLAAGVGIGYVAGKLLSSAVGKDLPLTPIPGGIGFSLQF